MVESPHWLLVRSYAARRRVVVLAATLAAVTLGAATVRAETPLGAATLSLHAAPEGLGCPTERQLADRVRSELTSLDQIVHSARLDVGVSIERAPNAFTAQVEIQGQPDGLRRLHAPRCESLADALAVSIAMILDAHAARSALAAQAEAAAPNRPEIATEGAAAKLKRLNASDSEAPPNALPRRKQPQPKQHARSIRLDVSGSVRTRHLKPRWRWSLFMNGGLSHELSTLIAGSVETNRQPWLFRLGAWWETPRDLQVAESGYVSRNRIGGLAAGCAMGGRALQWSVCGQLWLGRESFEGRDFTTTALSDRVFWAALGPSIGMVTGRQLKVGMELIVLARPWRDRYVARTSQTSQELSPIAAWLLLRFGWRGM